MPEWKFEIEKRLVGLSPSSLREFEIIEELSQHLEDRYAELKFDGHSDAEAYQIILTSLNDNQLLANELRCVEHRVVMEPVAFGATRRNLMENFLQDIRFAFRMLRIAPGFTAIAIMTLALGIGANAAIFSVINGVMLRPLPYGNPDRLVRMWESFPQRGWDFFSVSAPDYLDWKTRLQSFDQIAATNSRSLNLTDVGEAERLSGAAVTVSLLPTLGVQPMLGRNFLPAEEQVNGDNRVVILSHGLWNRQFGADPKLVGKTIRLDNESYTVVGVLPETFRWIGGGGDAFIPLVIAPGVKPEQNRGNHNFDVFGGLKPGVTVQQGTAELASVADNLAKEYSGTNRDETVRVSTLRDVFVPAESQRALYVLMGAVILVLLIACANVAGLLISRGSMRHKEIAIRLALGAGRQRIIAQLMSESLLLAFLGCGFGLLLAYMGIGVLHSINPASIPQIETVQLDGRVVAFAIGLSMLTVLFFGLGPALRISNPDLNQTLRDGGRGGTAGRARLRFRKILVVAEIAFSLVLLIGAGLMIRSFWQLQNVQPGFPSDNLLTMEVNLPGSKYGRHAKWDAFFAETFERIGALPGVQSVGTINIAPFQTGNTVMDANVVPQPANTPRVGVDWRIASPGYFKTLGIPILKGRSTDEGDIDESQASAVISDSLADRLFGKDDPIGKQVRLGGGTWNVVGVVGNVKTQGLDKGSRMVLYMPLKQFIVWNKMAVVVRTQGEPQQAIEQIRSVMKTIDPDVPISNTQTMTSLITVSVAPQKFNTVLLTVFAAIALGLALIGTYALMAYSVTQRNHEIGIRLAVGASPGQILSMILREGVLLTATGAVLGVAGAFAVSKWLESLLFEVKPTDPVSFAAMAILLVAVGLLACYIPARRATSVDPMVALRNE